MFIKIDVKTHFIDAVTNISVTGLNAKSVPLCLKSP